MVAINSEITGLRELVKNSDKLKKSFAGSALRTALRNAGNPVLKEAKARVPVDEGDLKKSLKSHATVKKSGFGYVDIGPEKGEVFYGHIVELGSSQQSARPFLRPALDQADKDGSIQSEFIEALNKTIAKQLGKLSG